MAVYLLVMHESMLQTAIPVRYVDIEVAWVGDYEADVFIGGRNDVGGEIYRYLFQIGSEQHGCLRNYVIPNLDVSSAGWELRIITNYSRPYHLAVRLYCRSAYGQTLGVLTEHQMTKLAD